MSKHPLCTNIPFPATTAPSAADYVSVFSDPDGDLLIFAASEGVHDARAYHSANDFESRPVIGGVMQSSILNHSEMVFVATCWQTTRSFRHNLGGNYQRTLSQCSEPRVLITLYPVVAYSTCVHCAGLIGSDMDNKWSHVTDVGWIRERGCRAASFRTLGAYNQNLTTGLMATPL
jgi:hypothetical protein